MDLRLFVAVVSRFKKLAIGGLVAAIVLAGLAYTRGSAPVWEAQGEVLITQANDPWGGATPEVLQAGGYLGALSSVYSALANGDAVQTAVRRAAGVPNGFVSAAEVVDPATGNPEPLVTLTASASTANAALKLAEKTPAVLQKYISDEQASANVPTDKRVQLATIKNGFPPQPASGKSLTFPLLIFAGVIGAVLTLILMLENLNPKTAAALGLAPESAGAGSVAELATVLGALVQHQQGVAAPSGVPDKRWAGASSGEPRTRNLREAVATNGHSIDESARVDEPGLESADRDAAVVKRLLRRS